MRHVFIIRFIRVIRVLFVFVEFTLSLNLRLHYISSKKNLRKIECLTTLDFQKTNYLKTNLLKQIKSYP